MIREVNGVPVQMTAQEEQAHIADQQAQTTIIEAQKTEYNNALNQIKTVAQSAVGVQLQNLTAAQVRGLMAILLFKAGGVDEATLTVNPLNQWV